MFVGFLLELREAKVPVSLKEFLTLAEAMRRNLAAYSVEDFYYLARAALVKDERNLDKFDRVFGHHFKGIETLSADEPAIPEEWLKKLGEKVLTDEEKKLIEAMGGWEKLMETLQQRLQEQKGRHEGGKIGTKAARNGSAPPEPRPMAPMATIPRACASARTRIATTAR